MTYDLTDEHWIPIRWVQGGEEAPLLGLREALTEAHRIREITAPSLQTAALYRLLQALFIRLYVHPEDEDDDSGWTNNRWATLWQQGHLDAERIASYFDCWQSGAAKPPRFDLLHPERPFYGHPRPEKPSEGQANWLVPVWAKGNNETLFDHTTDDTCTMLSLPEAARAIVETQAYALGGLAGPGRLRFEDGPLSRGLVFWICGYNLFEALLLNTPPAEFTRMRSGRNDLPAWEKDLPDDAPGAEEGYLDFLTWQSRHVRLLVDDTDPEPMVCNVLIHQGKKWVSKSADPLGALRTKKDGSRYPFKLRAGQSLWREAPVWLGLELEGKKDLPPRTFEWLVTNTGSGGGLNREEVAWDVDVFGLANNKAKMELIRHERLTVHTAVLRSRLLQERVERAVMQADRQAKTLRAALRTCAARLATDTDASAVADGLQGERRYWASLGTGFLYDAQYEDGFSGWLDELAEIPDSHGEESDAFAEAAGLHLVRWTRTLHHAALKAYDEATEAFIGSPRRMQAVAEGRSRLSAAAKYAHVLAEAA